MQSLAPLKMDKMCFAEAATYYSIVIKAIDDEKASLIANEALSIYGESFGEGSSQYQEVKKLVETNI